MNLVVFSIKTKGPNNFARRLWTVFARFGFSEKQTRRALYIIIKAMQQYQAAPTFFIPAVVFRRHPKLINEIVHAGAEIGIHGYVHNDYRFLSETEQYEQTQKAVAVFHRADVPYYGFRNPYLGWTEASLRVFSQLGFMYESNEAVLHDVIDTKQLPPFLRDGYEKSLQLFQAVPCSVYSLRPKFEGMLLRIPTSIPDDEMLFDRLRITHPKEVGRIWSAVMQNVYNLGGLYTLNLHPERGILCKEALDILLSYARGLPLPVWTARLDEIAVWWKERSQFSFAITQQAPERWRVEVTSTLRATLLAHHVTVEDQPTASWFGNDVRIQASSFTVHAKQCPCIGLSLQTPQHVIDFLREQGYPAVHCSQEEAAHYSCYFDLPQGLGKTSQERAAKKEALVQHIAQVEAPFLYFGCWPNGHRAALAITGDIDSVTIQDFFLRILEVR